MCILVRFEQTSASINLRNISCLKPMPIFYGLDAFCQFDLPLTRRPSTLAQDRDRDRTISRAAIAEAE